MTDFNEIKPLVGEHYQVIATDRVYVITGVEGGCVDLSLLNFEKATVPGIRSFRRILFKNISPLMVRVNKKKPSSLKDRQVWRYGNSQIQIKINKNNINPEFIFSDIVTGELIQRFRAGPVYSSSFLKTAEFVRSHE